MYKSCIFDVYNVYFHGESDVYFESLHLPCYLLPYFVHLNPLQNIHRYIYIYLTSLCLYIMMIVFVLMCSCRNTMHCVVVLLLNLAHFYISSNYFKSLCIFGYTTCIFLLCIVRCECKFQFCCIKFFLRKDHF